MINFILGIITGIILFIIAIKYWLNKQDAIQFEDKMHYYIIQRKPWDKDYTDHERITQIKQTFINWINTHKDD